jgi:hypothetical protein
MEIALVELRRAAHFYNWRVNPTGLELCNLAFNNAFCTYFGSDVRKNGAFPAKVCSLELLTNFKDH